MSKNPKVSVIISVFNDEKFVEKSINSILQSDYDNFEVIVCNDCSTDKTKDILEAIKDKRIKLFSNPKNCGLASSLNNCLQKATGKYIMRMDGDDECLPHRMREQVDFLENNPDIALCGGHVQIIDNNDQKIGVMKKNFDVTFKDIFKTSSFVHPSTMIRKSVLDEVGGYSVRKETRRAEDFDLWCKIYQKGYKGVNLQKILIYYREDFSGYQKRKFKYRVDVFKLMKEWRKKLKLPIKYLFYAFRIILIGFIPKRILFKLKKSRNMKKQKELNIS